MPDFKDKLEGEGSALIGMVALILGTMAVLDAYATMLQITGTGVIGQALTQSAYREATTQFVIGGAGAVFGLALVIFASATVVENRLEELLEGTR